MPDKFHNHKIWCWVNTIWLVWLGSVSSTQIHAAEIYAADMSVKTLGEYIYEVEVDYYRDCSTDGFTNVIWTVVCLQNNKMVQIKPTEVDVNDVSLSCNSSCDPVKNGGKGWALHVFRDTINLKDPQFSDFVNNCEIEIFIKGTRAGNAALDKPKEYGNSLYLNICKAKVNNTPQFSVPPKIRGCSNQSIYLAPGLLETDGDSVSFGFGCFVDEQNQRNCYVNQNPWTFYYPPNLPPNRWVPNRRAKPPWGITLDEQTGDFIFHPIIANEEGGLAIKVTEWRKNQQSGKMEIISKTLRDLYLAIDSCPPDYTQEIHPDTNFFQVCEGEQLCIGFYTKDWGDTSKGILADSVQLKVDYSMDSVTLTKQQIGKQQKVTFCWQTQIGDSRTTPYTVTAKTLDNSCPIQNLSSKSFQIKVKPIVRMRTSVSYLACGRVAIHTQMEEEVSQPYSEIKLFNIKGQEVDQRSAYFESSGIAYQEDYKNENHDTIQVLTQDTIVVKYKAYNLPFYCGQTYYDTLIVSDTLMKVNFGKGLDTITCSGAEVTLELKDVINGVGPYSILWSNADTGKLARFKSNKLHTELSVKVEDVRGCKTKAWASVYANALPAFSLGPDVLLCGGDSTRIFPDVPATVWWNKDGKKVTKSNDLRPLAIQWKQNGIPIIGDLNDTFSIKETTRYTLFVEDSLGCTFQDAVSVMVNDTFGAFTGKDEVRCWGDFKLIHTTSIDTVNKDVSFVWLSGEDTVSTSEYYVWNGADTTLLKLIVTVKQNGKTCVAKDSTQLTAIPYIPITMPSSRQMCCDAENINLDVQMPAAPKGGEWYSPYKANLVQNGVFRPLAGCHPTETAMHTVYYEIKDPEHGCHSIDSVLMRVHPLPQVQMTEVKYCQDETPIVLNDYIASDNKETGGTHKFSCRDCNGYKEYNLLKDLYPLDPVKNEYVLEVQKDKYTPKNGYDSIRLSYTYTSKHGCSNTDIFYVGIGTYPELEIPIPRYINSGKPISRFGRICKEEEGIQLSGIPDGGQWQITPQTHPLLITGGIFNSAVADSGVSYKLTYTYQHPQSGCTSHKNLFIDVICNGITSVWTPDKKENIHIPNAFTPFNEGINNSFKPLYYGREKVQFNVFNRQGVLVFQTEDIEIGWDGMYQGKEAPAGTYVYQLILAPGTANQQLVQGTFMLLR